MTLDEEKVLKKLKNKHTKESIILLDYIEKLEKENKELKETLKYTQDSWFNDTQKLDKLQKELDNRIPIQDSEKEQIDKVLNYISKLENTINKQSKDISNNLLELQKKDKRIKMLIDLLNSEGCLNFNTYEEKIKYIDKLIELENKE